MKKIVHCILFIIFVASAFQLSAAPSYGTIMPERGKFFGGMESYNLFDRDLEGEFGSVRSFQRFITLSYGITDSISLDLKAGTGSVKQHPLDRDEIDYYSSFAGGYGLRVKLFDLQKSKCRGVFGFQHISVHPRGIELEGVENKTILDDWQFSLLVSKSLKKYVPYLGMKWSRVDYIHWVGQNRKRRMSDLTESYGAIVGINFPLITRVVVNIEGHCIDEKALALGFMYQF